MRKRKSEQAPLSFPTTQLPMSRGHPFSRRLDEILDVLILGRVAGPSPLRELDLPMRSE